jgi:RNA binding exosome subunit
VTDFHHLRFRTFAHATEDEHRVREALAFAAGDDPEIGLTEAEGHHRNPIRILTTEFEKAPPIDDFWARLVDEPGAIRTIRNGLEDRVDDDCNLYLRLSKQSAARERLRLATTDDVIRVRAKVAAYPAKPESARETLRTYFDDLETS